MVSETTIVVVSFVTGGVSLAIIIFISVYMWNRKRKRQRIADRKSLDKIESEKHEEQSPELKKSEENINTNIMGNDTVKVNKQKDVLSEKENQTAKGVSEEKEIYPKFVSLFTVGSENVAKSARKKVSVTRCQRLNKSIHTSNEPNKNERSVKRNETAVIPVNTQNTSEFTDERSDNPANTLVNRSRVNRSDSLLNTFIDKPKFNEKERKHDEDIALETKTKHVTHLFRKQSRCWEDLTSDLNDLECSISKETEEETGVKKKDKTTQSDTSDSDNLSYVVKTDRNTFHSMKRTTLENNCDVDASGWDSDDMITKEGQPIHASIHSDDALYRVAQQTLTVVKKELQRQESPTVFETIENKTLQRPQTPQPVTEHDHKKVSTLFRCKSFPSSLSLGTSKFKPCANIDKHSHSDSMNNLDSIPNERSTTIAITDVNDTNLNKDVEPFTTNDAVAGLNALIKYTNTDAEDSQTESIDHQVTNSVLETDKEGHTTINATVINEPPGIDEHITQRSDSKEGTHNNAFQMHYVDESNGMTVHVPIEYEKESFITPFGSSVDCTAASSEPQRTQHKDETPENNTLNPLNYGGNPRLLRIDEVEQNPNIPIIIHGTNAEKSKSLRFYKAGTFNRELAVSNEFMKPTGSRSPGNRKNIDMTSRPRKRKSSVLRAATPIPKTDAKPKKGILKQCPGQKFVLNLSIPEEENFHKHEETKCAENDAEAHVFNNGITATTYNAIEDIEGETHLSYNVCTLPQENQNCDENEHTKGRRHVFNTVILSSTGNGCGESEAALHVFDNAITAQKEIENVDEHEEAYNEELKGEPNEFYNVITTATKTSFVETDPEICVFDNVGTSPTKNENFDTQEETNEDEIKGKPYVFDNVITTKAGNPFGQTDVEPYVSNNVHTATTENENVDKTNCEQNVFENDCSILAGNAIVGTDTDSRMLNHVKTDPADNAFRESMSLTSPSKGTNLFLTEIASENELHEDQPQTFVGCSTAEETRIENNEIEDNQILEADYSAMSAMTTDPMKTSDMTEILDMPDRLQQNQKSGYTLNTGGISKRVDTKEDKLLKDGALDSNILICEELSGFNDGIKHRELVLSTLKDDIFNCKQKLGPIFGEDKPDQTHTGTNLNTTHSSVIKVEESSLGHSSDGQSVTEVRNTMDNNTVGDDAITLVSENSFNKHHVDPLDVLAMKIEHSTDDSNSMNPLLKHEKRNFLDSGPILAKRQAHIKTDNYFKGDLNRASTEKTVHLTKPASGKEEITENKHVVSSTPSTPKVVFVETGMDQLIDQTTVSAEESHNIKAKRRKKKNRSKSLVGLSLNENEMATPKPKQRQASCREVRLIPVKTRGTIDRKEGLIDNENPSEFLSFHLSTRIDDTTSSDNKLVSARSLSPIVLQSHMLSQTHDGQTQSDNQYFDANAIETISKANPTLHPVKRRKSTRGKAKPIKTSNETETKVTGISSDLTGLIPSAILDSNAKNARSDRPRSAKTRSKPIAETPTTNRNGQTGELFAAGNTQSGLLDIGLKKPETFHSIRNENSERNKPVSRSKSIGSPHKRFDRLSSDKISVALNGSRYDLQSIAGSKIEKIRSVQTHSYSKYVNEANHVTPNNSSTLLWNVQHKTHKIDEQLTNNRTERKPSKDDPDMNLDKPSLRQRPQSSYGRMRCRSFNQSKGSHIDRRPTSACDLSAGRGTTLNRPTERGSVSITRQDDTLSETGTSSDFDEDVKPFDSTNTLLNSISSFGKLDANPKFNYATKSPIEKNRLAHSFSFTGLNNNKRIANTVVHTADSQSVHVAQLSSSRGSLSIPKSVRRHTINTDFSALKTEHSTPRSSTPIITDGNLLQTDGDINKIKHPRYAEQYKYQRR